MVLLGNYSLKLLKITIDGAAFFSVIPYKWNRKSECMSLVPKITTKGHLRGWDCIKYLYLIYQVFMLIRLGQLVSGQAHDFIYYILGTCYTFGFSVATLIQVMLIHREAELLCFFNRFIQFFKEVEGKQCRISHVNIWVFTVFRVSRQLFPSH